MNRTVLLLRSYGELSYICKTLFAAENHNPHRSGVGEEGIISAWGIQEGLSEEKAFMLSLNCFIQYTLICPKRCIIIT